MATRRAEAEWRGDLSHGQGIMAVASGAFRGAYSFPSRFEEGEGTNPEELIGAAHAGCFSMALAAGLSKAGHPPRRIHTAATVHLERAGDGFAITQIELRTDADVPGMDEAAFHRQADAAKQNCPVSKALAGTRITLNATLASPRTEAA